MPFVTAQEAALYAPAMVFTALVGESPSFASLPSKAESHTSATAFSKAVLFASVVSILKPTFSRRVPAE